MTRMASIKRGGGAAGRLEIAELFQHPFPLKY
jgi:hypothetical protein